MLLFVVSPLYALLNLCVSFIFVIAFSTSGIPLDDITGYRKALIASNFLGQLFYFATGAALLFMALNRTKWNITPMAGMTSEFFFLLLCKRMSILRGLLMYAMLVGTNDIYPSVQYALPPQPFYGGPQMQQQQPISSYYGQQPYPQQPLVTPPQQQQQQQQQQQYVQPMPQGVPLA